MGSVFHSSFKLFRCILVLLSLTLEVLLALTAEHLKWPLGIVPYKLSDSFSIKDAVVIKDAMETISKQTCVTFVPHLDEKDFLSVMGSPLYYGCWSSFGYAHGERFIFLGTNIRNSCVHQGPVLYFLMRILGFPYEHQRPDRDAHIKVNLANVKPDKWHTLEKISKENIIFDLETESYDFESLMHPNETRYAIDPSKPIFSPKVQVKTERGQRNRLSQGDLKKIRSAYSCPPINKSSVVFTATFCNLFLCFTFLMFCNTTRSKIK